MNKVNERRILQAIWNTRHMEGAPLYFEKTCDSRSNSQRRGSYYPDLETGMEVERMITHQDWVEDPTCPNLIPGCTAFYARGERGILGTVALVNLMEEAELFLADPKGTGEALAEIRFSCPTFQEVINTTLILGMEQGQEVVFTFHPGLPTPHDPGVKVEPYSTRKLTVKEALSMGLKTAKIIG